MKVRSNNFKKRSDLTNMTSSVSSETALDFIYVRSSCCTNWVNTSFLKEDIMMSIQGQLITCRYHIIIA